MRQKRAGTGKKTRESGSALVYILIAIALLGALTVTFMEPSSQQTQTQNSFKVVSDLKSQIDFIRSGIQECVLAYHKGDSNIPSAQQKNRPYPILPSAAYFDSNGVDPDSISTDEVRYIRCPGNYASIPADHQLIFTGTAGKYMPEPPAMFEDWQYYTGDDGVFIWIYTTASDPFLETALDKLDEEFAECEADAIDATGGSAVDMDSESTAIAECPTGARCFRVRMTTKGTPVYQSGSDEASGC